MQRGILVAIAVIGVSAGFIANVEALGPPPENQVIQLVSFNKDDPPSGPDIVLIGPAVMIDLMGVEVELGEGGQGGPDTTHPVVTITSVR